VTPGFSLYQGLAHLAPMGADYDSSALSKAHRPAGTEGAFRALDDWKIGNDADVVNGVPAALSFFKHIGHAYDGNQTGSVLGFDGVADGIVSHTFTNLAAGDYSVFVGGSDYLAQEISNPNILTKYGVTGTLAVSAVPEPETYAMLLAGLGLMGAIVRRRNQSPVTKVAYS
jgi:hypothetical protein